MLSDAFAEYYLLQLRARPRVMRPPVERIHATLASVRFRSLTRILRGTICKQMMGLTLEQASLP
jgi:hypothetical protein